MEDTYKRILKLLISQLTARGGVLLADGQFWTQLLEKADSDSEAEGQSIPSHDDFVTLYERIDELERKVAEQQPPFDVSAGPVNPTGDVDSVEF